MLTRSVTRVRRGFSLVELLVAMVVGGVVLALLTLAGLRQQRLIADLFDDAALSGQLREASALLPIDLRVLGSAAGDLREARDTALEARGTIANAIVCDTARGSVVLAAVTDSADTYTSYATSIEPGDTAWLYQSVNGNESWVPRAIASVAATAAGRCSPIGPLLRADVAARARTAITLDSAGDAAGDAAFIGRPLRITRSLRLSLYRSSDGTWNLGERDWNPSTQRFNSIQPLAGPFLPANTAGLTLEYLDSNRAAMPTPLADPRAAAAIAFTLRGETRHAVRALGATQQGRRVDTARVVVLLRNRR